MSEIKRYRTVDLMRGIAIVSMVIYHTLWDLINVFDADIPWFYSEGGELFQKFIRWSFILLSGFCWSMGKKRLKRALMVIGASVIITAVTAVFTPSNTIIHGVLSLLGAAMLITIPLDKIYKKISPYIGFGLSLILFILTYDVELGKFGINGVWTCNLSDSLYKNVITAFFGFPPRRFSSLDYVPFFPWVFAFWMGYFIYQEIKRRDWLKYLSFISFKPLEWLGRHSLIIYMLHQPLVYGLLHLIYYF